MPKEASKQLLSGASFSLLGVAWSGVLAANFEHAPGAL